MMRTWMTWIVVGATCACSHPSSGSSGPPQGEARDPVKPGSAPVVSSALVSALPPAVAPSASAPPPSASAAMDAPAPKSSASVGASAPKPSASVSPALSAQQRRARLRSDCQKGVPNACSDLFSESDDEEERLWALQTACAVDKEDREGACRRLQLFMTGRLH